MNKTVNINIGGLFFHIDENAYQKLSRYFDAIKRSLSNSSGKDEIMKDIEMRVAELFSDRQKSDKHVINLNDVDEVVKVMGQPEDYRIDDDATEQPKSTNFNSNKIKKLYRDKDRGSIAGVCTGLGHYFGIDAVWIKILFLILFFGFGTGIVAYLVLWIVMPEAITTTEKLEMTGEPVTISNIEKKVREEFENVSNKIKNVDYDELGNKVKNTAENAGDKIGNIFMSIFEVFAKVLGAVIVVISSILLIGICISAIIMIFSASLPNNTVFNYIHTPISFDTPLWIQGILFLLAFGIPVFFILILGLKLLVTKLKSIGNVAKYSLLALWIIAVGFVVTLGIKEASQEAYDGKSIKKETINITSTDTLFVKFKNNDYYSKNVNDTRDFWLTVDETNKEVVYSNDIRFEIMKTDEKLPYVQIEKTSEGNSPGDAKNKAEKIKYNYSIIGNQLVLDNYFLTDRNSKWKDQEVSIYLYLPKGALLKADESLEGFDYSNDDLFNLHFSSDDYIYKMDDSKVKCLNCPISENDHNDVLIDDEVLTEDVSVEENDTIKSISIEVNGKNVIKTVKGKKEGLELSKDGIIIKTK